MPNRDLARQLISDISSHDLYTQFRVDLSQHKLIISGSLTPELTEQIRAHKTDLIDYLTTPPDVVGICRNGYRVRWVCTLHGLWVCGCYYGQPVEQKPVVRSTSKLHGYWTKEKSVV
jgi:hypothetical protein